MWLLGAFYAVALLSTRIYYRLHASGSPAPPRGPALLVANHPNALLDPLLVMVAARRPVQFLAKSPLFSDPLIGWAVRAVGALPVYRQQDDATRVGLNEETFHAVHQALADGAAIGIFPEGISHHEPSLVTLKTGAARIALGAVPAIDGELPIVPVGLVFESKGEFRSRAFVVVGPPVEWRDLAGRRPSDQSAVRELTQRIQRSLHQVTVNLKRHEDAALIAAATAIYAAEVEPAASSDVEATRRILAANALTQLTLDGDEAATDMSNRLRRHMRTLDVLGLTPSDLRRRRDVRSAARWTARRLSPLTLLTAVTAAAGAALFWIPYRAAGWMAGRGSSPDMVATRKLLSGAGLFIAWIIALALAAGIALGWPAGVIALILLPVLALKTLSYGERWTAAARDVRSFFVRRFRPTPLEELRDRQRCIARDLRSLYERVSADAGTAQPD
jgi:glycerol-3-phosphate O-acyltransferase / dihydroxyacetone phosphate acyltransferase